MKNSASKREQNQACLNFAEREQNRHKVSMKNGLTPIENKVL